MLEAQPLHRVGEFDVDAEIVGIQLELIAFEQAAILVDIHGQGRDIAVDVQLPVPVARRIGLKIDVLRAASEDAIFASPIFASHWLTLTCLDSVDMHNNACFWSGLEENARNMHFVSCSADGADLHPIGLGKRRLRQFCLQKCC